MSKKRCRKCGHEWLPRVDDPLECPNCKTRDWEDKHLFKEGIKI